MYHPQEAATFLQDLRAGKSATHNVPDTLYPPSVEDAFTVQDLVVQERLHSHDSKPLGYKIACTNQQVIDLLGVSGPFPGRLMTHSTYESGAALLASDFRLRIMEAEFGFELARDVPLADTAYTADSIRSYVGAFLPGLEIVDHGYTDFSRVGESALIADNAIHGACVFGKPVKNWQDTDFPGHSVTLSVNGDVFATGIGANVLGNPLSALAWLANHLAGRGIVLRAGERILTGTAGKIYPAQTGDAVTADFGDLGSVSLAFR